MIVFGRDAAIEVPPFDDDVQMIPRARARGPRVHRPGRRDESWPQATFPEDAAKRIVVVSDGNENLGDAVEQARGSPPPASGIDVGAGPTTQSRAEVIVERADDPQRRPPRPAVRPEVVVTNTAQPTADRLGRVSAASWSISAALSTGSLEVLDTRPEDEIVVLPPGKKVFTVRQEIDAAGFYTYKAEFFPTGPGRRRHAAEQRATAFTHVRGKGQVLLIEDHEHPGEFERLVRQASRDRTWK